MTLTKMFDASNPPFNPFPGCGAVAGYIGGNTPHVWTLDEWQRFHDLRQFPIYVGYDRSDGKADGQEAADEMHRLGWAPFQANRRVVIVDMETEVNPAYLDAFGQEIWAAGFMTYVYESLVAYGHNPPKEGIWLAEYDGQADIPSLDYVVAHQYVPNIAWDGTAVDLSVVTDDFLVHGGVGLRH